MKDTLGDRIKNNYEDIFRIKLPRRMPMIIRLDGRAFHSLTKGMNRPFDDNFISAMANTALYLCENIQNCVFGYVQSDEISLLLNDYSRLTTEAWFDKNLQKMCSISASMATLAFNKELRKFSDKEGVFDSRCFVLPAAEVVNAFLSRQQDATRNSIQMLGQSQFSHKELQNLSCNQIQDKLMLERKINWNDIGTNKKRGTCIRKVLVDGINKFVIDTEPPIFSKDRNYIDDLLVPEQE